MNTKDEEISELSTLLTDVLQEKEQMKQRHEEEKERYEQGNEQDKLRYEQRIMEMEEQLALANQPKPGPSITKTRQSTSTSKR